MEDEDMASNGPSCIDATRAADMPTIRAAFYGRTNSPGSDGARIIALQHRVCVTALAGHATITHAYYDIARRHDHPPWLIDDVQHFGGPRQRDGGWYDLADALQDPNRHFHVVIMESPDRLSRRIHEALDREHLAAQNGVPIHYADGPLPAQLTSNR